LSASTSITIDTSASTVVEHFAVKLNISRATARLFLEELQKTAVSGEVQGVEEASKDVSFVEVLEGTVITLPEHEEGILDPFRDVMELAATPHQEEILISQLTGLSIEELRSLGGVPAPKEKPFKTGFNV